MIKKWAITHPFIQHYRIVDFVALALLDFACVLALLAVVLFARVEVLFLARVLFFVDAPHIFEDALALVVEDFAVVRLLARVLDAALVEFIAFARVELDFLAPVVVEHLLAEEVVVVLLAIYFTSIKFKAYNFVTLILH